MNVFNYIEKYRDKSFKKIKFNEIDNLIFSILIYLNFNDIVENNKNSLTLYEVGSLFIGKYKYKEVCSIGFSPKNAYDILIKIYDSERYSQVLLSNYIYIGDENEQFSAITFKINNEYKYISFEGTDHLLSGWKEDFQMSYKFPVPSQSYAIQYLNKVVKLTDKKVIVGGHSKGGNLALVSSMNINFIKRKKIFAIYNNDGPGLRQKEIMSKKYKKIKDRYIHIIPDYSYIGILLRNENDKVIKSSKKNIMSHDMINWQIDDKKLINSELSNISIKVKNSILSWLDKHDDKDRKIAIDTIFTTLEDSGVYYTKDIKKIKSVLNIIENLKDVDEEFKIIVKDFINYNLNYILYEKVEEKKYKI